MPKTIKLSEEFVEIARGEGRVMHRSIGAQVEFWAKLGRQVEALGALGPAHVRKLLGGSGTVQDLSEIDGALYTRLLARKLESIDDLRAGGHPIATADAKGNVVIEKSRKRRRPSRPASRS